MVHNHALIKPSYTDSEDSYSNMRTRKMSQSCMFDFVDRMTLRYVDSEY